MVMLVPTGVELLAACKSKMARNVISPRLGWLDAIPGAIWKSSSSLHSAFACCVRNAGPPVQLVLFSESS